MCLKYQCVAYKDIIRCDLCCNKKQIRNRDPQSIAITLTVRSIGRGGKVFASAKVANLYKNP